MPHSRAFRILFVCLVCVGLGQSMLFSILPPAAREIGISPFQVSTIFATSVQGLGPLTKPGASLLVMSIIGGAVLTAVMGRVSDATHLIRLAIFVPTICFVVIAFYSLTSRKSGPVEVGAIPGASGH